jgi:hypothetical protein
MVLFALSGIWLIADAVSQMSRPSAAGIANAAALTHVLL